jgi:hypothetical protein
MASEIKVSSVKAKDGTAGISIADSTGAITANGGIANAGTITAGTLGDNVTGKLTQMTNQSLDGMAARSFTVPTTSKHVVMVVQGVSDANSTNIFLRIGTGGTAVTSGYNGTSAVIGNSVATGVVSQTAGLVLPTPSDANIITLICDWYNIYGNNWVGKYNGTLTNSTYQYHGTTYIALSGAINIVSITDDNGSFDAGNVNVFYSH